MAISQTMSNPNEWMQFYQTNNFSNITQSETPPTTTATATAATTTTTTSSRNNNNLSPDQGRVSKPPLRRRSRTSRRTPTTLLNTDTANFRAMVQQFTGAPTTQFAQRSQLHGGGGGNFGFTQNIAPAGGLHVQYPNQQQNMLMMNDYMHGGGGGGGSGGGGVSSHAPPGSSSGNEIQNFENYRI